MSTALQQRLLSAAMIGGPQTVANLVDLGVSHELFTEAAHQQIWSGILEAAARDRKTSTILVARHAFGTQLTKENAELVSTIFKMEPTSLWARKIAEELIGEHRRKLVVANLGRALEVAQEDKPWPIVWDDVSENLIGTIRDASSSMKVRDLGTIIDEAIAYETSDTAQGRIGTGIAAFDASFGMIAPGEVVVIAGRPGTGKTALAGQIAYQTVRQVGPVMFVSLEMPDYAIATRFAQHHGGRATVISRGCSREDYMAAKESRRKSLEELKAHKERLFIYDSKLQHIARIQAQARLLNGRSGGLALMVVDYIGLVDSGEQKAVREQQVAAVSRKLKLLSNELKVPILLLSQFNRESEKDERPPRLSDLRESGSIEQDADRVWLMYNSPTAPIVADSPAGIIRIEQAKCRNGQAGIATDVQFHRPTFTFTRS